MAPASLKAGSLPCRSRQGRSAVMLLKNTVLPKVILNGPVFLVGAAYIVSLKQHRNDKPQNIDAYFNRLYQLKLCWNTPIGFG